MKLKKKLICLLLVLSYVTGASVSPINADSSMGTSDFNELLGERHETEINNEIPKQEKKIQISDFTDVKQKDWFYPYLEYLVENELIKGKTESTFEPYGNFSYAECSTVIVRYLGLEDEAQKRMNEISSRSPELKNQWYAGYFEVLSELGIFDDYGLFKVKKGQLVSVDKERANSPAPRYVFAESISESFELSSTLKAQNVFPEIGGSGREFIVGGGYKKYVLEAYKALISDFEDIPEKSRENVLKAYYNGIFNGDITGNFYPNNNLNRGEMAKVLATITDYSLRTRLIEEGYGEKVTQEMLHTDAVGRKTLSYDVWSGLLEDNAKNSISYDGKTVTYESINDAPSGYAVDVCLYDKKGGGYVLKAQSTLHSYNEGSFTYDTKNAKILLLLRNTANDAEVEGAYSMVIENGEITERGTNIREM